MPQVDLQKMLQQAQKMQEKLSDAQGKLKDVEVSASAGGGAVKVSVTGDMRLSSVTIDPQACDPDDVALLQDMVLAAANEALGKAQDVAGRQMSDATGLAGLNIPGLS